MGGSRQAAAIAAAAVALLGLPTYAFAVTGPPPTTTEVRMHGYSGRAGAAVGLVAHLWSAADEPVAGQPMSLFRTASFGGPETLVGTATTDVDGAAAFQVTPQENAYYVARHPETTPAGASVGAAYYTVTAAQSDPGPPERVAAEAADAALRVSWLAPEDDGGSAVTSYVVKAVGGGETVTVTANGSARTATVTGLANGTPYTVAVTAKTAQGSATTTKQEWTTPRANAPVPPAGGTRVCGRLPFGVTTWSSAGSPYVVCPLGVIVATGSTLVVNGAEVRFHASAEPGYGEPYGIDVRGGGLRVAGSDLHGEAGRRGEWSGIRVDYPPEDTDGYLRSGSTVTLDGSTVRHGVDGVFAFAEGSWLRLTDTVLSDTSRDGLSSAMRVRANGLTVRDAGRTGVDATCRQVQLWKETDCAVAFDGITVQRAAGRGLNVETRGQVSVRNAVVTASGTTAPVSEAARLTGMTVSYGTGQQVEDVRGGGNGIDAVVLDLTLTNDLTWRTPVAGSAAAPAPLGFVVRNLRMAAGRSVTFPANSVVKGVPAPMDCRTVYYEWPVSEPCKGGIEVESGTLDASAGGTTFTGAADPSAGLATCPSALAPACAPAEPWWSGLVVRGDTGTARLTGATVRGAAVGLTAISGQAPGIATTVTGTTFDRDGKALYALDYNDPGGSVSLAGVTVTDSPVSVVAQGIATVGLTDVTVRRSGGVAVDGTYNARCDGNPVNVTVAGLLVEDAPGSGLTLSYACHPSVRGVTVRRSGLPGAGDAFGVPAVALHAVVATFGTGQDVDGLTGGGNGIDAVALGGEVPGSMLWRSPTNASADHPLGHLIGDDVRMTAGTLTVPAGAVVASLRGRQLWLPEASLDATAGGAVFVDAHDPLAGLGCRLGCAPRDWAGVLVGSTSLVVGDARIAGATFRGGPLTVVRIDTADRVVSIADSSFDRPVTIRSPMHVTVSGSRFPQLAVEAARDAQVTGNTVPAGGWIRVSGVGTAGTPFVLRDNAVGAGTDQPAYLLSDARATFGPGGTVSGNTGAGGNAVIQLAGVETPADLTWVTPTADPEQHPVGYVVAMHASAVPARGLTVSGAHTFTVPEGAVVKADVLTLSGAALDARAGGATFTAPSDDTVGLTTCHWWYTAPCDDPETDPYRSLTSLHASAGVAVRAARLHAYLDVTSWNAHAPGSPAYGLTLADSYLDGVLVTTGSPASVTGTRVVRGGVTLRSGTGSVVRDVEITGAGHPGLRLTDDPSADVRGTVVTGAGRQPNSIERAAVELSGTTNGTFTCLDVHGNAGGVAVLTQPVTITDSTLTGNTAQASYDLDDAVAATTSGVWWGQPGGPVPGQVRDPAKHTDSNPRSAAPECSVAEAVAPPGAPRAVAASPGVDSLSVTWDAPVSDGGAPVTAYTVTALPGGASVTVAGDQRSATVDGLDAGRPYVVSVRAVNAVAAGSPSPFTPEARPSAPGPAPRTATTLTSAAPALVTYGTTATVTGTLATAAGPLAGRNVDLRVRRAGTSTWGAPVTLTTDSTGALSYPLMLSATSEVLLSYGGDAGTLPTSAPIRTVQVRPVVTAAFAKTSVLYGTTVALTGRVSPNLAGRPVRLERYTRYGWQRVTTTYLTSTSAYRFTVRPPGRATYSYRVVYDATTSHARAVSPTRTVTAT